MLFHVMLHKIIEKILHPKNETMGFTLFLNIITTYSLAWCVCRIIYYANVVCIGLF